MPSKLGYGDNGGGPIPPFAPLVFEIEIKDIKRGLLIPPPVEASPAPEVKK
ncbi:hypothetical protein D9M72_650770 [compost metagenome]